MVAAFAGNSLSAARMVSGLPVEGPDDGVVFPAAEGVEYHIGVATGSAYWAGTEFELSWAPGARELPGNDDFAGAAPTFGGFGAGTVAFDELTVEHGEPAASGVRTAWWRWQAPQDGRHTWLIERTAGFPPRRNPTADGGVRGRGTGRAGSRRHRRRRRDDGSAGDVRRPCGHRLPVRRGAPP